jgi:hypothetical protein
MVIDDAANDKSLAALMSSTSGGTCLKGVVAFVDVFTADGTDSSAVFVDMLRSLGARVSDEQANRFSTLSLPSPVGMWRSGETV